MTGISFIVCGVERTAEGKFRCGCCSELFDDIEELAMSMCGDCLGGNPDCQNCRDADAVSMTRWGSKRGRVHRITTGGPEYRSACGQRFTADTMTGPGDSPWCQHCWRDANQIEEDLHG